MKTLSLISIVLLILYSCNKDDKNGYDDTTESYQYEFYDSSMILVKYDTSITNYTGINDTVIFVSTSIVNGNNYVFKYEYILDVDNSKLPDGDYSESIYFEVNDSVNNFSYSDTNLSELNSSFSHHCYCSILGLVAADSGTIEGIRIDENNWEIYINARFTEVGANEEYPYQKQFSISETFTRK